MTPKLNSVIDDALKLTPSERAELVSQILTSFDSVARARIDALWAEEAEDRIRAYERGKMNAVSAEDVFNEMDRDAE